MRVLVLTNLYPSAVRPNRATFNRQQFRALAARHEVQVIAPVAWTDELATRRHSGRAEAPPGWEESCGGVVSHSPCYLFTPRILRGQYGHFLVRSVRSCFQGVAKEFRPDVVLGCWAYPDGWAAVELAREARLPVAIKVHGSDLLTIGAHPSRRRRTAEALARADAVIGVSHHLADHAIRLGANPARVHVVHNGVDSDVFHPGSRETARRHLKLDATGPLILFVGNLLPVKGVDVLIDALASLSRDGVAFQCVLAGDGPLKGELRARIERRGIAERVRMIGARPLEELPHWYRAADLLVLPSRSEGIPNVLLEAGACGIPFVATRVGGIPEIAPPERLAPANDAPALAQRIAAFLTSGGSRQCSTTFTPGSWDDSARALASVLQGILPARVATASRAA